MYRLYGVDKEIPNYETLAKKYSEPHTQPVSFRVEVRLEDEPDVFTGTFIVTSIGPFRLADGADQFIFGYIKRPDGNELHLGYPIQIGTGAIEGTFEESRPISKSA